MPLYIERELSFNVTAAGHGATVRATYTVPANQIAVIDFVYLELRETIATGLLLASILALTTRTSIRFLSLTTLNAIGVYTIATPVNALLNAGDTINLTTINASANNLTFVGNMQIREYQ